MCETDQEKELKELIEKAQAHLTSSISLNESKCGHEVKEAKACIDSAFEKLNQCSNFPWDKYSPCGCDKNIYGLAGEIYARIDEPTAIEFYEKYQYRILLEIMDFEKIREKGVIVYSFRSCNKFTIKDLIERTISLGRPKCMNDPFDSLLLWWGDRNNLEKAIDDNQHIDAMMKSYQYYRIRSFCANTDTMNADDSIPRNILMWSHYADSHKGICIRYRLKNDFIYTNCKGFIPDNHSHIILKKIDYGNDCSENDIINLEEKSIDANIAFTRKYRTWSYEREVRLISYNTKNEDDYISIPNDNSANIEAIYFGCKCTDEDKALVIKCIGDTNVQFYKMQPDFHNIYNLKIAPND
jgi:hypothetical protein